MFTPNRRDVPSDKWVVQSV